MLPYGAEVGDPGDSASESGALRRPSEIDARWRRCCARAALTGSPGHGQEQCRLCGTLGRVAGHAQRLEVSERLGKSRTAATGRGQLVNATAAAIWRRLPSGCEVSTRLTRVPLVAVDYSTSTLKRQQEPCGGT